MSGAFFTFDYWSHDIKLNASAVGGPPHLTLAYTKNEVGFGIEKAWNAVKTTALIGQTLTLDRLVVNSFEITPGVTRSDLLWCFDSASSLVLLSEMEAFLESIGYSEEKVAQARDAKKKVPFHITLKAGMSAQDLMRIGRTDRPGKIVVTGVYVD